MFRLTVFPYPSTDLVNLPVLRRWLLITSRTKTTRCDRVWIKSDCLWKIWYFVTELETSKAFSVVQAYRIACISRCRQQRWWFWMTAFLNDSLSERTWRQPFWMKIDIARPPGRAMGISHVLEICPKFVTFMVVLFAISWYIALHFIGSP